MMAKNAGFAKYMQDKALKKPKMHAGQSCKTRDSWQV